MTSTTSSCPDGALWNTWDRGRLLKLVEKLPSSTRIGISHYNERQYSVFRVWESRSVHLFFDDRSGEPRAVHVTKICSDKTKTVEWLSGGLRAWVDALEIDRDALLEVLL